jgi:glycosyltransferase involved in cell wall biosynthesis
MAANGETAELVPAAYKSKVQIMSTGGMSDSEIGERPILGRPTGFVILFVALLRPLKGGELAIKAMHRLVRAGTSATLVVIGSGSEGRRLAALAEALGIADRVQFLGGLPRTEVLSWMCAGDALLFPSLRDSGPLVVLEAMMAEKPVVCLDLGGPAYFVNDECGIKVKPGDPEQVIHDLAAALKKLAGNPELCRALGKSGRRRVMHHFDWDKRGERMLEIYRQATNGSTASQRERSHAGGA